MPPKFADEHDLSVDDRYKVAPGYSAEPELADGTDDAIRRVWAVRTNKGWAALFRSRGKLSQFGECALVQALVLCECLELCDIGLGIPLSGLLANDDAHVRHSAEGVNQLGVVHPHGAAEDGLTERTDPGWRGQLVLKAVDKLGKDVEPEDRFPRGVFNEPVQRRREGLRVLLISHSSASRTSPMSYT